MRKNNKGYSLVELMIAIALFAIIFIQIIGFMKSSQKAYMKGVNEVTLQTEAQQVILQLEELMIDAQVALDIDNAVAVDPTTSNGIAPNPLNPNPTNATINLGEKFTIKWSDALAYQFELKRAEGYSDFGSLYLTVMTKDPTDPSATYTGSGEQLLAEYVNNVTIDKGVGDADYEMASRVMVSVSMNNGVKGYEVSKDLYLRNDLGSGSKKTAPVADGDGILEVLRCKAYCLSDLFPDSSGVPYETYAFVGTQSDYNIYQDGYGKWYIEVKPSSNANFTGTFACNVVGKSTGKADYNIAVNTVPVEVSAKDGEKYVGYYYAPICQDTPTRLTYVPLLGISLENVDPSNYSVKLIYPATRTDIAHEVNVTGIKFLDSVDTSVKISGAECHTSPLGNGKLYGCGSGTFGLCVYKSAKSIVVYSDKWHNNEGYEFAAFCQDVKDLGAKLPYFKCEFNFPTSLCTKTLKLDLYMYPVLGKEAAPIDTTAYWEITPGKNM